MRKHSLNFTAVAVLAVAKADRGDWLTWVIFCGMPILGVCSVCYLNNATAINASCRRACRRVRNLFHRQGGEDGNQHDLESGYHPRPEYPLPPPQVAEACERYFNPGDPASDNESGTMPQETPRGGHEAENQGDAGESNVHGSHSNQAN